jgi:hypothetical protein
MGLTVHTHGALAGDFGGWAGELALSASGARWLKAATGVMITLQWGLYYALPNAASWLRRRSGAPLALCWIGAALAFL